MRTNRAALVRSVLEGVALNITWLFEYYQRFLKRPVPSVRILGGGGRSDLWCSIIASCLNRPVERIADPLHAQLRGAALWSRVSLGELSLAAAAELVDLDQTFRPDPAATAIYREHYREYRSLAKSLRGFYQRMNGSS